MLAAHLIWRYILIFMGLYQQISVIDTLNLLLEETFPKKMNQDDFVILPNDNVTGCRLLYCPTYHYYFIYSDTCISVPSGTSMSNGIGLYLRTTKIERIYENDFANWTQLLTLNIEMNSELAEIETGTFTYLTGLTNLSISNNYKLRGIEPDLFTGLVNLKYLKFIKNNIHHLSEFVLSLSPLFLPSLSVLDLSQNPIDKISTNDLRVLSRSNVEVINFVWCGLTNIDARSFSPLRKLKALNLGNNNLSSETLAKLVQSLSKTARNFQKLTISGNLLHKNVSLLFEAIAKSNIAELDIKYNHFNLQQPGLFPIMPKLNSLDISGIMAVNVDQQIFNEKCMPNLTKLIAAKNRLPSVLPGLLLPNLLELDLSENCCDDSCFDSSMFKINEFIFDGMDKLKILNLGKNALYHIKVNMFYGLNNLESLNLSNCTIFNVDAYSFGNLTNLKYLDLSYNKFIMNYSMNTATFSGLISLESLNLDSCSLFAHVNTKLFDEIPNLKVLSLRGNSLTELDSLWFTPLNSLIHLDLAYNDLIEWDDKVFDNNGGLEELNLFSNRIMHLTVAMLHDFSRLNKLDLRENQWDCSCQIVLSVKEYLLNNNESIAWLGPLNYTKNWCFSPKKWTNTLLVKYIEENVDGDHCNNLKLALIIFICFMVVTLISVSTIIVYYLRWHLRYWIFLLRQAMRFNYFPGKKKTNLTADSKYKYDAFVSYSHEDRNFVVRLVSMLETQSPYYTLCVFERDFSVGNIITENVVDCLSTSRRTILVLSDSFARSTWCLWEMHLAQHKRLFFKDEETEPLIIIKLGEIMDKHMTPTLRYLIKSRIYLQWNPDPKKQKIFWQKLREALAPPKVQV